jgi:hypothetical protein
VPGKSADVMLIPSELATSEETAWIIRSLEELLPQNLYGMLIVDAIRIG